MFDRIRHVGWFAVEIGLMVVSLAVLLDIILGKQGGAVITGIADNTTAFLQSLPAGSLLGLGALGTLYLIARARLKI